MSSFCLFEDATKKSNGADPINDQPILPVLNWGSVNIPNEDLGPSSEPVMVILEDTNDSGYASISAIPEDLITSNWTITPQIVRKG